MRTMDKPAAPREPASPASERTSRRTGTFSALRRDPGGSREARQRAAVILDVFAGISTPIDAATVLSMSLTRYYAFESRLLAALVTACENRPRGPGVSVDRRIALLEAEVARLRQECARKQALVRAVHRTMGVPVADPKPLAKGRKRRRRPVVRAAHVATALRTQATAGSPTDASS